MLNKSEKNKLKKLARKISSNINIKYEDALDQVARENGYLNWKSLNTGINNVNLEAYVTYGVEDIKNSMTIQLHQIEAIHLINCCESYIKIYDTLLNKDTGNVENIYKQKELTEKILNQIFKLAEDKINSDDENCISLELYGYELGQLLILLYDYGKSIETQLKSFESSDQNKDEQYHLTQIGGIIGDVLSRVTSQIKK